METLQQLIAANFPIASQTSDADKIFLLKILSVFKAKSRRFKYLEIGSFMGGSLTPFLREDLCELVVSVDERERQQPDERGAKFDYSGVTHETMINNLLSRGIDISKLAVHDGPIQTYKSGKEKFSVVFIDGEHTDVACVKDFVWTYPLMENDSVIMFHDSTIVYKALSIIQELLLQKNVEYKMIKHETSEITVVLFGEFSQLNYGNCLGGIEDWAAFQARAEAAMLSAVISNRVKFEMSYKINPMPLYRAS